MRRRFKLPLKRRKNSLWAICLILSACAGSLLLDSPPKTTDFSATLLFVSDGDTLTVRAGGEKRRIRLFGVDAPELKQRRGADALAFLEGVLTDNLTLQCQPKPDRYQRFVCDVYTAQNLWVNKALIENGWAWHYTAYSKNAELAAAQIAARTAKKGLWADKNPTPPWEWRQKQR